MSRRGLTDEAKTAIVAALRDVFRARGWEGASLSDLAAATGLGRATLYHHFPNGKADMAAAALADVESRLDQELLAPLRGEGAPVERLAAMCAMLDAYYRGGELGCLLGALSYGQKEHGLGGRVAASFDSWAGALADLAIEAGANAADARRNAVTTIAAVQGALVLASGIGSAEPFRMTLDRLPDLLLREPSGSRRSSGTS